MIFWLNVNLNKVPYQIVSYGKNNICIPYGPYSKRCEEKKDFVTAVAYVVQYLLQWSEGIIQEFRRLLMCFAMFREKVQFYFALFY